FGLKIGKLSHRTSIKDGLGRHIGSCGPLNRNFLNENHAIKGTLQELINTAEKTAFLGDRFRSYIRAGIYQKKSSDPVQLLAVLDNSIMVKYFKDEKPTYARMTAHLPNKNESYECLIKIQHELIRSEEK
ncbi:hypothetical protein ACVUSH_19350, partial [Escherichia coli]